MVDNNNIEALIARAREFARKSLSDNLDEVNREDYFLFQISKFLLLKESMIKKDSNESTIYFNIDENHQYLKAIKYIVDYVREHGTLISNTDIKVIISPTGFTASAKLKSYIRDFHKIRDSISHGRYHIDSDKGCIVLDNDNLKPGCPADSSTYVIRGELPIEVLELFSCVVENPKDVYNEEDIKAVEEEIKKRRNLYGYHNVSKLNVYDAFKKYNNSNLLSLSSNKISDSIYNYNYVDNNTYKYDKYETINKTAREKEKRLLQLIRELINDENYSAEQKNRILKQLQRYGIVDSYIDFKRIVVKPNKQPTQGYIDKLVLVISEISSIIGMSNNPKDNMKISSVLNYMLVFLSFKHESINPKNKSNLGKLKMSRINPIYIAGKKQDYEDKITAIRNYVKANIIDVFKTHGDKVGKLQEYANHPTQSLRDSINYLFNKSYEDLLNRLASRNVDIITSIRNSLEHGNIDKVDGNIKLYDQSNQNDPATKSFECIGSPEDFYEIICCVDLDQEQDFTFDDFMTEMQEILEKEMFDEFKEIVESIHKININALISDLKQVASKK